MILPILGVWYINVMLALLVPVCLLLMLVVLIQRPKGGGLSGAFGGAGSSQAVFGAKVGDVLTWATIVLFTLFVLLSMGLAVTVKNANKISHEMISEPAPKSAPVKSPISGGQPAAPVDVKESTEKAPPVPAAEVPAAPATPAAPAAPAKPADTGAKP